MEMNTFAVEFTKPHSPKLELEYANYYGTSKPEVRYGLPHFRHGGVAFVGRHLSGRATGGRHIHDWVFDVRAGWAIME